jgi:hypothetical protein
MNFYVPAVWDVARPLPSRTGPSQATSKKLQENVNNRFETRGAKGACSGLTP